MLRGRVNLEERVEMSAELEFGGTGCSVSSGVSRARPPSGRGLLDSPMHLTFLLGRGT
jgi:hypothetical protein